MIEESQEVTGREGTVVESEPAVRGGGLPLPDLDIHLLAMVRRREPSEEGHEVLTKAMRDLL
jgi:hypothetical protein